MYVYYIYNTSLKSYTMLASDVQVSTPSIDSLKTKRSIFFQLVYPFNCCIVILHSNISRLSLRRRWYFFLDERQLVENFCRS